MQELRDHRESDISVLYVEDDVQTLDRVSGMLKRRLRTLYTAENGAEGLEKFRTLTPDIVITDIQMPVMDGLEMAGKIKELDGKAQIIVLSAYDDMSYLMESIDLGIAGYVLKPVQMPRLFSAIERCAEVVVLTRDKRRYFMEREGLITELRQSLDKVKKLSGLLPICSSCKRIRDDKGYWNQLEAYISMHSEAEFSHGICPECIEILYPELAHRKK